MCVQPFHRGQQFCFRADLFKRLPGGGLEGDAPDEVRELAEKRWQAKQDKDWPLADQLRDQITEMGWQVKDTKDGFELSPA